MSLDVAPPPSVAAAPPAAAAKARNGWRYLRRTISSPTLAQAPLVVPVPLEDTPPLPSLPFDLVESAAQREQRRKWSRTKERLHAFLVASLDDPGELEEWSLRVIRDGTETEEPSVVEMTPLGCTRRLPPQGADGKTLERRNGTWLLRECTTAPLGGITKSAWRVNGLRGFPHGVFVEFRKKEKKSKVTQDREDGKENDGLCVVDSGRGSWFRRRRTSTVSTAKSDKGSTKGDRCE